jgi:hypothetical protein
MAVLGPDDAPLLKTYTIFVLEFHDMATWNHEPVAMAIPGLVVETLVVL